ncbi:MAG: pimeloyl-CoA dehydrogenase small subunit [Gammaproteobacteria bacterium TMED134]|nr:MAG: pimeloyl-CoA dehydrogenase small subunit [Gammaproteobacteria bacterium TMED134]RZO72145.1 MAG: pimeloyl-CoA dehydrogenase small subunit [OM182 bacterium]
MNFDLSEEQQLLQDSVARFIEDNYALETRQHLVASDLGFSEPYWQTMADLGWLGINVPEAHGGIGGNQSDTMVLMQALGQGLVLEPIFASAILGTRAIVDGANEDTCTRLLPSLVSGERRLSVAYAEEQARFDLDDVVTRITPQDDGYRISGRKSMVFHAQGSDYLVVSGRSYGGQTDRDGITLLLVDAASEGVRMTSFPTVDGLRASEIEFEDVFVPKAHLLGAEGGGYSLLESIAIDGILALSAEAVGAMEVLYKDTVSYTQEREQFDHPLSDFQVLQHRMVDMFMEYEQCKSLLYRATLEVVQRGHAALKTVHALKYMVGKVGTFIGENAVQLHGGMGVTEELRVGHYFKRLLVIDAQFGNSDYHLAKFAD